MPMDDLARFVNGLALQKYPPADGKSVPVIKMPARSRSTIGADRASADLDPDYIVQDGDILFSNGLVRWNACYGREDRDALNQHLFKVIPASYPRWLSIRRFICISKTSATSRRERRRRWAKSSVIISLGCQAAIPPPALLSAASYNTESRLSRLPVASAKYSHRCARRLFVSCCFRSSSPASCG